MEVTNVHRRFIAASAGDVGALLDSLSSRADRLWPEQWPRMRFDRALSVGAVGGHGPVRYVVDQYDPGSSVTFRFKAPDGFDGTHGFEVRPLADGRTELRHVLKMEAKRGATISWPVVFRPLHDALIEDAFDQAERSLGVGPAEARSWSWYVRFLRQAVGLISRHSSRVG